MRPRLGQRGAERGPGQLDDLQRPHDPPAVAGQHRRRGGRVDLGQPGVQRGRADRRELAPPAGRARPGRCRGTPARRGRRARRGPSRRPAAARVPAARSRSISARASRRYSATEAGSRTCQRSSRWCGTPPRSASVGLGRADVHAAVELHRVGVDHLAAEPLRQRDGQRGLARRGRPDDGDHRRRGPSRQVPVGDEVADAEGRLVVVQPRRRRPARRAPRRPPARPGTPAASSRAPSSASSAASAAASPAPSAAATAASNGSAAGSR